LIDNGECRRILLNSKSFEKVVYIKGKDLRMKIVMLAKSLKPLSGLVVLLMACSYSASAANLSNGGINTNFLAQDPTTPARAPGGAPADTTTTPTTATTPTVSHSKKHKKHKTVKPKKQKPKKHHKINYHHQYITPGLALQGGVSHQHKHKPLSSSESSRVQQLENTISQPSSSPANTSKIGTPSNSMPGVSP